MSIYIDSATLTEAQAARELGWVKGVTTNPSILARTGQPAESLLAALAGLGFDQLFYQLTAQTMEGMRLEARSAQKIVASAQSGSGLVLKVPPTELGFRFVAECCWEYTFCLTAVFSPVQAAVASEAGARYVAVYLNRATRLMGDGAGLTQKVAKALSRSQTEIIAASLKSTDDAWTALEAGAQHLTVPYEVLCSLIEHPLSAQTVAQFNQEGIGLVGFE